MTKGKPSYQTITVLGKELNNRVFIKAHIKNRAQLYEFFRKWQKQDDKLVLIKSLFEATFVNQLLYGHRKSFAYRLQVHIKLEA